MLKRVALAAIALLSIELCWTSAALAYRAEPGTRAANFRGFDIVNRESIELEDYLGQWVYVEFWATWCGPCMKDLPGMLAATRPYVDSGQLKVITINADHPEQLSEVKRVVRNLRIEYPVIYDGGAYDETWGFPLPAVEWGVTSFPATFLINPDGVIVANYIWGKADLAKVLEFYLAEPRPVMGINGFAYLHEDGSSVSIFANVLNRGREDVRLRLRGSMSRLIWDEEHVVVDSEEIAISPLAMSATLSFDEFNEAVHEFVIDTQEDWHSLTFSLFLSVPGAEHAAEKEQGYELLFTGREFLRIKLERIDGKWVVRP